VQPFIYLGAWRLNSYGLCLVVGLFIAYAALVAELRRRPLTGVRASVVMAVTAIAAVIGARVDWTLEEPGRTTLSSLASGGIAFYGALILGGCAAFVLERLYRLRRFALIDDLCVPWALAHGVARIGCFLSGDGDYGTPTNLPWGMAFPHGVVPTYVRVHPTPLYECALSLIIASALWHRGSPTRRPCAAPGEVFALALIWSGIARFLVEFIRLNPRTLWGLTVAQCIALVSIAAGIGLLRAVHLFTRSQPDMQSASIAACSQSACRLHGISHGRAGYP
jgi:phosphatidylglycerol:prolipoprotein diacylglycerol transferase